MADREGDVYIAGIDSSIEAWSTETTQKTIAAALRQANADSTGILRLLGLLGQKAGITEKEMASIRDEIAKGNAVVKQSTVKASATATASTAEEKKQTSNLTSLLSAFGETTNQINKNAREQAKRDSIRDDLIDAGMNNTQALAAANNQMNVEKGKAAAAKVAAFVGIASTFTTTAAAAIKTGFQERADMAGDMRQSGLFAGIDEANQGFISIAKTISATNFTFGEAAEFTKRFSQAVGVVGVKGALDFSNAMAQGSLETGAGYMERFSMDFGQVANMSGQYLESLRASGQLSGRSDTQMRTGMSNFMNNVEMTANVLKISMEEAAELMQKSVSPVQAGLMATLEASQRERAESALLAMNVQGGPVGDALAARLAAGSDSNFLLSDKYSELMSMGAVGMETQDFVSKLAAKIESGDGSEDWQTEFGKQYIEFADRLTEVGKDNRMMLQTNDSIAALVGQVMASRENYDDAGARVSGGDNADKVQMLSVEQQRGALRLSEDALNTQMGHFTEQLVQLTDTLEEAAQTSYDWMAGHEEGIRMAATAGRWISEIWPNIVTFIADATSDDSEASTSMRVKNAKKDLRRAEERLEMGVDHTGKKFDQGQRFRANAAVNEAKLAVTRALGYQEDFREEKAIDDANHIRIKKRTASTDIITSQMATANATNVDYDTVAEVKAKLVALEAELKIAKDLKKVDREWKDGYYQESSGELRDQSGEYVKSTKELIAQFKDVLKALKN